MTSPRLTRTAAFILASLLALVGITAVPAQAVADERPAPPPTTYSAQALPTVQINGVVWDQLVVGNTVYVVGQFTSARPAGAPSGVGETPRSNILAYNLTTGELVTGFAPTLNGPGRALAVSDDSKTLYVAGAFNKVNDKWHNGVAALNIADGSGSLIDSFNPVFNTTVNAIDVSGNTLYAGGAFTKVNGLQRVKVAAVDATTGATLEWSGSAEGTNAQVYAVRVSPDGSKVAVGGSFTQFNRSSRPGYGLVLLDATTARVLPTDVNSYIRNGGRWGAILDIEVDETGFYGAGYSQSPREANIEGTFRASWDGRMTWIEPCHGDSYSLYASKDEVYVASHAHSCETIYGFPDIRQPNGVSTTYHFGTSFTNSPDVTIRRQGTGGYHDWSGRKSPELKGWFPEFVPGTFTGQHQATWDVTASGDYLLYGGEFTGVNGQPQQGLVRFAKRAGSAGLVPEGNAQTLGLELSSEADNHVTASFSQTWDRDDTTLTYSLFRDGGAKPVATAEITSRFWELGSGTLEDTDAPGGTHTYSLVVSDPAGHTVASAPVSVEVQGTPEEPPAAQPGDALATDTFERTSGSGWGETSPGGPWSVSARSRFSVDGANGLIKLDRAGWTSTATLGSVSSAATKVSTTFDMTEAVTGKGLYTSVVLRNNDAGFYAVKIVTSASGAVVAQLVSTVGGQETVLDSKTVSGTWTPGTPIHVEGTAIGEGTTTLTGSVWLGDAKDAATALSGSDSTAELQGAGSVGLRVYVSASATSKSQVMSVADFSAVVAG